MSEENAETEAVKAKEDEAAKIATEAPKEEEAFDKDRAMQTIQKLREIEKEARKEKKELEQLKAEKKQREDAALTESERLKKERNALEAENAKIKSDLLRREAVEAAGLPGTWADRIKGSTKEELFADAEELAKTLPTLKTAPKVPPTNPNNATTVETDAQKRERLFGKQGNPFDFENVKAKGGGVFHN